jgi:ribosomal protein S18 acetylase RimI-like enzyme
MDIEIRPLSPALLKEYLFFFDNMIFTDNPDWSKCYCYSFHFTGPSTEWTEENNRSAVSRLITLEQMRGFLAYDGSQPVGWCNANDRNNYARLIELYDLVDNSADRAASIVCFVVSPGYRKKGIASALLERTCSDYSSLGYDYLEAYPGKNMHTCEDHYKGPMSMYEKSGFKIHQETRDFIVVRKYLKP